MQEQRQLRDLSSRQGQAASGRDGNYGAPSVLFVSLIGKWINARVSLHRDTHVKALARRDR